MSVPAPARQWGVTPAISTALPTPQDNTLNDALVAELKKQNNYEAPEETEKRKQTLHLLYRITLEFVKEASRRRGFAEKQLAQFGGKIFPYGSYRLGVYGPGSDIDTLVVAPRHVSREDFFDIFPGLLEKMAPAGAIGFMTPVPDAFVPIIKMELNNIEIDLIFARIASLHTVPVTLDLKDNNLLKGLDERELRSVNGTRVTDEILSLVPQAKTFRTALRAVKLWAQRRAIYANIMGFPGGVAWAMLVARVCQLYPAATGSTIVAKFFMIIGRWNWPAPVILKQIENGPLNMKVWNPQIYPSDKRNIMPIITPAYPSMCATFNISKSGKEVIMRELTRGGEVVNKIMNGQLPWSALFDRHTFFTQDHKYYLSIVASSNNKDAALAWSGMVESKVRILVLKLEDQTDVIDLARPFTKGYEREHKCKTDAEVAEVRKGSVKYQISETQTTDENHDPKRTAAAQDGVTVDGAEGEAKPETEDGGQIIYTTTFYIGLDVKPNNKNLNITYPIQTFRDMCTSWANYNPELHELEVTPTRCYDLPDDMFDFEKGEVKPQKPKKKVTPGAKKATTTAQKRSFEEVEPQENGTNGTAKRQASTPAIAAATPA